MGMRSQIAMGIAGFALSTVALGAIDVSAAGRDLVAGRGSGTAEGAAGATFELAVAATSEPDGTDARGRLAVTFVAPGGEVTSFSGTVNCLVVVGNVAVVTGLIERTNQPIFAPEGFPFSAAIFDNSELGVPDTFIAQGGIGDPRPSPCRPPTDGVLATAEQGNFVVHDALPTQ